jgi:sarcosine oxidase gamma subunit
VAEWIAKSPLAGQGPVRHGGVDLAEVDLGRVTSVAPFGTVQGFPAPNTVEMWGGARLVWTGRGQAFLLGGDPDGLDDAALTDQSDGWVGLSLTGPGAADVLARLVPLDLRAMTGCARTVLGHMPLILIAITGGFEMLTFRSMAQTAWHEVETAMKMWAAREC